jgi:hypothetical protein
MFKSLKEGFKKLTNVSDKDKAKAKASAQTANNIANSSTAKASNTKSSVRPKAKRKGMRSILK